MVKFFANIPAPELVEGGHILPPKLWSTTAYGQRSQGMYAEDADNLMRLLMTMTSTKL